MKLWVTDGSCWGFVVDVVVILWLCVEEDWWGVIWVCVWWCRCVATAAVMVCDEELWSRDSVCERRIVFTGRRDISMDEIVPHRVQRYNRSRHWLGFSWHESWTHWNKCNRVEGRHRHLVPGMNRASSNTDTCLLQIEQCVLALCCELLFGRRELLCDDDVKLVCCDNGDWLSWEGGRFRHRQTGQLRGSRWRWDCLIYW